VAAAAPVKKANMVELAEANVTAVAVRTGGDKVTGSTIPVVVDVMENTSGFASVGVNEQFYNGVGDQSRSSTWIAAMTASQVLDGIITDHKYNVQVRGLVDGPSMGLLLTSTMMALLNGETILPDVTMTGAVNPDGTAGPVGGIPHKMEGARDKGFKAFGYPVGCRMQDNENTNPPEQVDVEVWGRDLGLKVVPLKNVRDAYFLLTGKKLQRGEPVSDDELALSPALSKRIRSVCSSLSADLKSRYAEINKKFGLINEKSFYAALRQNWRAKAMFEGLRKDIQDGAQLFEEANQSLNGDSVAQAFIQFQRADQLLSAAEVQESLFIPLVEKGISYDLLETWRSMYEDSKRSSEDKLKSLKLALPDYREKTTVGGRMEALHAYIQYGEALAAWLSGKNNDTVISINLEKLKGYKNFLINASNQRKLSASGSGKSDGNRITEVEAAVAQEHEQLFYGLIDYIKSSSIDWNRAARIAQIIKEFGTAGNEVGPPAKENEEFLRKMGEAYASASGATLAYFDALIIKTEAEKRSQDENRTVSVEEVSREFKFNQPTYGLIKVATLYAQREPEQGRGLWIPANSLDRFTAAFYAYTQSSAYLMKYYTFGAAANSPEAKAAGQGDTSFTKRKSLAATLDGARENVLIEVGRLKDELGFVPESIKFHFDMATTLKYSNDDADLLHALKSYWRCNLLCYLTRQMAKGD